MKKIILIAALLIPVALWAAGDDKEDKKKKKDAETQLKEKVKELKKQLTDTVSFLEKRDKQRLDSISGLVSTHQQKETLLKSQLDSLQESFNRLKAQHEQLALDLAKKDEQLKALDRLSETVYLQCLLYPLEGRYNEQEVEDARKSLVELGIWERDDYKEMGVYRDMLVNYGRFNRQLIEFMDSQAVILKKKGWLLNGITTNAILDDMQQLDYMPFYKEHDNPPYKSIIYLDDVLTDYIKLISTNGTISEESYEAVVARLRPKK